MVILPDLSRFPSNVCVAVVDAQACRSAAVACSAGAPAGFKRGHAHLRALALQHLPGGVVHGHAVFADDQRIGVPEALGMEARPPSYTDGERRQW